MKIFMTIVPTTKGGGPLRWCEIVKMVYSYLFFHVFSVTMGFLP